MTAEKMVIWLAKGKVTGNFDEEAQEHYFTDSSGKRASYPSPYMLRKRLELASQLGVVGVGVWEMGQMPAAFIDVY